MSAMTAYRNVRPQVRRFGRRGGFTLTEIMIALGVMVIGLGMAAGAFHAGIQNHMMTIDDILGQLIGENAVAMAKIRLRHTPHNTGDAAWKAHNRIGTSFSVVEDKDPAGKPGILVLTDKRYPIPPEPLEGQDPRRSDLSRMGYLLIARRATTKKLRNDYIFKVVPYTLQKRGNYADTVTVSNAMVMDGPTDADGDGEPDYSKVMAPGKVALLPRGAKVISISSSGELDQITVTKVLSPFAVQLDKYIPKGLRTLLVLLVRDADGNVVASDEDRIELLNGYDVRTSLTPAKE